MLRNFKVKMNMPENKHIFISHSKKDESLAKCLVSTIKTFYDIEDEYIRCTSVPGYKLPSGVNIAATIQKELQKAEVVIGIVTPNSLESAWELCEIGAAWGLAKNFVPMLAGLDPENVPGPLGFTNFWQLKNSNDVYSFLNEVDKYLPNYRRHLERSAEDDSIRKLVSSAETYNSPDIEKIPVTCLYSLHSSSVKVRNDTEIFQDFNVSRIQGNNPNPAHHLWADAFTNSSIKALIMKNKDENYLRVWFENGVRTETQSEWSSGWASNILIRTQNEALGNEKEEGGLKHNCLQFYVRIPKEEMNEQYLNEVGISLRLLDRRLTYWVYKTVGYGEKPTQFRVTNNDWQKFTIKLLPEHFGLFKNDGNWMYLKRNNNGDPCPDFTVLVGVSFIFGSFTARQEEPREGKGVIDIKDIRLAEC